MGVARVFLGLTALMWIGYGLVCFLDPDYLRQAAGVSYVSLTGMVDLRATYGGLQMAIGAVALAGALYVKATRQVLLMYATLCAGLGSARLAGALTSAEWSGYTLFAVCFELGSVAVALALLPRLRHVA